MNGFDDSKMNQLSSSSSSASISLSSSIGMGIANQMQPHSSICCLIEDSTRCSRAAGNASYSKRIEKQVAQRKLRLTVDQRAGHFYICEHHKAMIQSIRTSGKRKRKDSEDDNSNDIESDSHVADVDLLALQVNTLRRYKRHYRIQTRPGLNKSQLAEVYKH